MDTEIALEQESLGRYYTYAQFEDVLLNAIKALPQDFYALSYLGSSVENRSIYGLKLGHGSINVLAWSQMHGNESTTTRALIELMKSKDIFSLLKNISLYIIPVLNPDGAESWTRTNANNVDLNRDAVDLSQPESVILKDVIDFFEPDLALNLHGQRTIYGLENSVLPCQMSFLTPSADVNKTITSSRLKSMHLINQLVSDIKLEVKGDIGRYDDIFNENCWGDYCQSTGIPTILFEAGHAGDDYDRSEVTAITLNALKSVLSNVAVVNDDLSEDVSHEYFNLPNVQKNYVDILLHNVPSNDGKRSLALMYHEQEVAGDLMFIPMLYAINESAILYGHRVIDLDNHINYENDLLISPDMTVSSESLKINSFIK